MPLKLWVTDKSVGMRRASRAWHVKRAAMVQRAARKQEEEQDDGHGRVCGGGGLLWPEKGRA